MKRPRVSPGITLFLLSPIIGELLSGSAPPAEFFNPFGFTVITLLFGGGALVARELKIRWRKGVGSLLLLGSAYGVLEEGLIIASFQNPNHADLGVLREFGRWLGVNWVWSVELTMYHAIVSIVIPVLLVELIYPLRKPEKWLKGRWSLIIPILLVGDVTAGFLLFEQFNSFTPPLPQYLFFSGVCLALIYAAYRLPRDWARKGTRKMRRPRYYFFIAFLGALSMGFVFFVLPGQLKFIGAPVLVALIGASLQIGLLKHLAGFRWRDATNLHLHRLLFGSLFPFILFSFIQEVDQSRLDNTTGMSVVGTLFLLGLLILGNSIDKAEKKSPDTDTTIEETII